MCQNNINPSSMGATKMHTIDHVTLKRFWDTASRLGTFQIEGSGYWLLLPPGLFSPNGVSIRERAHGAESVQSDMALSQGHHFE